MQLTRTVEAESHHEAMQLVYDRKGWNTTSQGTERAEIAKFVEVEVEGVGPEPDSM